jgi:hypothetical protein
MPSKHDIQKLVDEHKKKYPRSKVFFDDYVIDKLITIHGLDALWQIQRMAESTLAEDAAQMEKEAREGRLDG